MNILSKIELPLLSVIIVVGLVFWLMLMLFNMVEANSAMASYLNPIVDEYNVLVNKCSGVTPPMAEFLDPELKGDVWRIGNVTI